MLRSRYRRILWFFARFLLNILWWDIILSRLGFRWLARRTRSKRMRGVAVHYRSLAIQMGGVMIKVGQFLSTRLDVLPIEITSELTGLQDEVRPEPLANILNVFQAEFKQTPDDVYEWFEATPLASASIGQVHRARLKSSSTELFHTVVVKIQRPRIDAIIDVDLSALRVVGSWLTRFTVVRKHADVPGLMEEFSRTLYEEIDYIHEAKNAERFAENFKERPNCVVPRVAWDHTTRRVLTLEDVYAIKITDYGGIEAAGIDRSEVAARLVDTYFKQVFDDRFFHADPHPGNLFVTPDGEKDANGHQPWKLVFVDFGMMGIVPDFLSGGLRELLIAIGTRDSARVIKAYQMLNVLLPGADLELLERAGTQVFERFWGKSVPEMASMHQEEARMFVREFEGLLYEMPFQIPQNFILLGRCASILSGMCSGLDPSFNVWVSIAPYAQKLIREETTTGLDFWLKQLLEILRTLAALPQKTDRLLNRLERGKLEVQNRDLKFQMARMERSQRRLTGAVFFAAFFIGSVQLYLAGEPFLAGAAALASLLSLGFSLFIRRPNL